MDLSPSEESLFEEAVLLYEEYGSGAAAAPRATRFDGGTGVTPQVFNRRLRQAHALGYGSNSPRRTDPGFRRVRQSEQYDASGNVRSVAIQDRLDVGPEYEAPPGHVVKGYSTLVDQDGRVIAQWIKTREGSDGDPIDHIRAAFRELPERASLGVGPDRTDGDLLTVYPVADPHIGALAWDDETGDGHYDLAIATDRLRDAVTRLVDRAPPAREALVLNLGDFFHMDDVRNVTPASMNVLDTDGRFQKVVWAGIRVTRDIVDLALQRHERVTIRNLPGNHDPHSSFALTCAIQAYYENEPRVRVEVDPGEYYFRRFGVTLIGAHHGHRCKPDRMAMLLADRRPEDWAASRHRWFLFGHFHHDRQVDVGSVRCESFRTVASRDAWNAAMGFTSAKSMQAVTLDRDLGEVERHRVNIFNK